MNYGLHLVIYFDIYLIVALSLNLVVGYCGLLTLAQAGFYALGAYAYAILAVRYGWGFVPASLVGAGIAAMASLAVSLPAWRLRGEFFVLVTLAVQALIYSALYNWSAPDVPVGSLANMTNGPFGITGIPRPAVVGHPIGSNLGMATFASVVAIICALVMLRLAHSPWGRLLQCMRDDELAARGLGKNTRALKVQAVAISSAMAAVGGALYAAHVRYVDPSAASLDESILILSMAVVGGLGNIRGPIVGAAVLIGLPEILRFIHFPDALAANIRLGLYGLLLILAMHFRPQGIAGSYRVE